jgi:hypothetical protein
MSKEVLLLELAAKAADMNVEWVSQYGVKELFDNDAHREWNPLVDDGDAFRLAVKLKLQPYFGDGTVTFVLGEKVIFELYKNDTYMATRRAIVCAAAEIGRDEMSREVLKPVDW